MAANGHLCVGGSRRYDHRPEGAALSDQETSDLLKGREAYRRHAWAEALARLSAADAVSSLGAEDLVALAYAHYWTGSIDAYLAVMERAYRAFVEAGDRAQAALAALMLQWDYMTKPARSLANGWYRHAARLLEGCPECAAHGYLAQSRTWQLLDAGDFEMALESAREIGEIGARLGDRDLETLGLARQAQVLVARGDPAAGLALLDEAVVAALGGELGTMITGVIYCAAVSMTRELGDYERAADWSAAAMRWCEREACTGFPGLCRVYNAEIAGRLGYLEQAHGDLVRACEELQQFGALTMAAAGFYELGEIHRRRGELEQAEEAYTRACEYGLDPEPGLSLLRLARGDARGAAAAINRAVSRAGVEGRPCTDLLACARLLPAQIQIALAANDLPTAERATERLEAIASSTESKLLKAEAACARSELALAHDDPETALEEATRARKLWQEIGMPYETARARLTAAAAHRALGDADAADFEQQLASTSLARLGVPADGPLEAGGKRAAAHGPRPDTPCHPLTARELDVLNLVAQGLTDAEIANRLYLSPHTVHRHVANIRAKTNQPSRAAVVAHANRLGIL